MDETTKVTQKADLRDYLAAERTFLAWIRTGLALMGFGFVVARFGLYLEELHLAQRTPSTSYGMSLWFGTALIVAGVFVYVLSAWHHLQLVRELNRGGPVSSRPSLQAVMVALFLALVGLAMAIYLIFIHNSTNQHFENKKEISMQTTATRGIIDKPSHHSVDETVERFRNILAAKGVKLFAVIDHSGEAEKAGITMPPTRLVIFGNPKAGTPLMLAAPSSAIDLPLKTLIWEDRQGKVWISYNSPAYLAERHGIPQELVQNIAVVETLAAKAAE